MISSGFTMAHQYEDNHDTLIILLYIKPKVMHTIARDTKTTLREFSKVLRPACSQRDGFCKIFNILRRYPSWNQRHIKQNVKALENNMWQNLLISFNENIFFFFLFALHDLWAKVNIILFYLSIQQYIYVIRHSIENNLVKIC